MTDGVPRQRSAEPIWLRCGICCGEHRCDGVHGSLRLAEETLLFQTDHAGCGDPVAAEPTGRRTRR